MTKLSKFKYLIYCIFFLILSCAEENPNLVNPPSQAGTVHIRLLNLASDKQERILSIDGKKTTQTPFKSVSEAINPPLDSGFVALLDNTSKEELIINRKLTFARGVTYTFIALPSHKGAEIYRSVDTMLIVQTSTTIPPKTLDAYIKFFNAYPDSTSDYYFRLGCPNGEMIIQPQSYKHQSPKTTIRSGKVAMTLLKRDFNGENVLGLYEFDFEKGAQYLLLLHDNGNGDEELSIIGQADKSNFALRPTKILNERNAYIRLINFSKSIISITKQPDDFIFDIIQPLTVSNYTDVSACGNLSKDLFIASNPINQELYSKDSISLEVLQKYSILIFDSADYPAKKLFIKKPIPAINKESNQISIQVFNAYPYESGINITVGARSSSTATTGYITGEILSANQTYFNISDIALIQSGALPITIFTSSQPSKYLSSAIIETTPGKDYLLIITSDNQGNPQITAIEENSQSTSLEFLPKGVFIQVVNSIAGFNNLLITTNKVLENATLNYAGSLATVLPVGHNAITFSNKSFSLNADHKDRILLIATGDPNNIEILNFTNPSMGATSNDYRRRIINASRDYPAISISEDTSKSHLVDYIEYGKSSPIITLNKERKVSIFFLNSLDNKVLFRIDDLLQVLGTNYTFIFTSKKGFDTTVIVQQEF